MSAIPVLLSCQAGAPDDPRTWSGTPARLLEALRQGGVIAPVPHSSKAASAAGMAGRLDALLGLRSGFMQGPTRRFASACSAAGAARRGNCAGTLHLGTFDVPWMMPAPPSFLYIDNSYDFWERHSSSAARLTPHQRRWFRRLERRALQRAAHIFTVGEHIAENVRGAFDIPGERVTAVGTGLGSIVPYAGPKDYSNGQLLIVAKVRPRDKGLFTLLEAFSLARQRQPRLTLTVIGGERYSELRGVEGVRATGWITAEELQRIFESAALYVMPAGYEPWGISYLEALSCRTPVLGLDRGALPEITAGGAYGFLAEPSASPARLAELLLGALSDPARLAAMGAEGQRYCAERYQWHKIARHISRVIFSTLIKDQAAAHD